MKNKHLTDSVIVGGGLAGALCALTLASVGARCIVLEKNRFADLLARDRRTTAINRGAVPLLKELGVWDSMASGAGLIRRIEIISDGARCTFDDALYDLQPFGYIVDNAVWRRILRDAIDKNPLIRWVDGAGVASLAEDETGITAQDTSGQSWRAQLLMAADGRESPVRALAGIDVRRHLYPESAMVGMVRHLQSHHETAFEVFLPTGPLALLPLKDPHISSFVWTEPTDHVAARLQAEDALFLKALSTQFGGYLGDMTLLGRPQAWPLTRILASSYVQNRVVLVGDAAHAIHPIAGQGFNLTLRDLVALRRALQPRLYAGLPLKEALSSYNRLRPLDAGVMAEATHALNTMFLKTGVVPRTVRKMGLTTLDRLPILKKPFVRHATGVSRLARLGL
ncbi:MAG: FAD-dependent monooxygenase [Alphaproteobacteria bacterium]